MGRVALRMPGGSRALVLVDGVPHQRAQHLVALNVADEGLDVFVERRIDEQRAEGAAARANVRHQRVGLRGDLVRVGEGLLRRARRWTAPTR
jgi:hypothetical protein